MNSNIIHILITRSLFINETKNTFKNNNKIETIFLNIIRIIF